MPALNSPDLKQLMQRAQVLGLQAKPELPEALRQMLSDADQQKRLLTAAEQQSICAWSGTQPACVDHLQTVMDRLIDQAKTVLLREQPGLVQPGGALHPEERARSCWRDCWQFMRVIIKAVAVGDPECTDPEGMGALRQLYAHMDVPIPALNVALEHLRHLSLAEIPVPESRREHSTLAQAFDHLSAELNKSAVKTCEASGDACVNSGQAGNRINAQ